MLEQLHMINYQKTFIDLQKIAYFLFKGTHENTQF